MVFFSLPGTVYRVDIMGKLYHFDAIVGFSQPGSGYNRAMNSHQNPLIIAFVSELMAQSRIESAARAAGYEVEWIESQEKIAPGVAEHPVQQHAEHLHGPGYFLMEAVTRQQPALLIFDLNNPAVPWREWIAMLRTAAATRRIPLIGYGSHVDVDSFQAAKKAGAQAVLARSAFFGDLPAVLGKYAHLPDQEALASECQKPLHPRAVRGLEHFNAGEYFEAHEELEAAWNADPTPARALYQGVLQVAVAYLQIERNNPDGAKKIFLRSRQWLCPLPDTCRGVDVKQLKEDAEEVEQALKEEGIEAAKKKFKGLVWEESKAA